MKTPDWLTRKRSLSPLRIATAVTLIFAAAAMAFFAAGLSRAVAQSRRRTGLAQAKAPSTEKGRNCSRRNKPSCFWLALAITDKPTSRS